VVAQNFLPCDREQELLLPPSLREWLAEDHLAWFVLDVVAELDLERFYAAYRRDGWGAAAHDPEMMVGLLVYAYAIGERSSRALERRCREDVAFRVITANHVPDHATVARFRVRHEAALGDLFGQVLGLCADAGLVSVGVVAVDGSKFAASASDRAVHSYDQIAREIGEEAGRIDAGEDAATSCLSIWPSARTAGLAARGKAAARARARGARGALRAGPARARRAAVSLPAAAGRGLAGGALREPRIRGPLGARCARARAQADGLVLSDLLCEVGVIDLA
jgi:transposase